MLLPLAGGRLRPRLGVGQSAWHGFWWRRDGAPHDRPAGMASLARLAAVDVPIPVVVRDDELRARRSSSLIFAVLKLLTDDYRHFWAFVGVGARDRRSRSARGSRSRRRAGSSRSGATRAALDSSASAMAARCCGPTHPRPRLRQRRPPRCLQQRIPAHGAAETAASGAPAMASEAADAPSDAADAASDATERRAVDRAGELTRSNPRLRRGARTRRGGCVRSTASKAPANAPFGAFPSTL